MALPPSGSDVNEFELVVIETPELSLYIKGKPYHQRYESLREYRDRSKFHDEKMYFFADGPDVDRIEVFDIREGDLVSGCELPPIFFENGVYQLVVSSKTGKTLHFHHEHPKLRKSVGPIGKGTQALLMGNLQFTNEVGYTTFSIHDGEQQLLEVTMEIFPTKLDYKEDYRDLLDEVNKEIYNLAYHFVKKTYLSASAIESKQPSWSEFYRLIDEHFSGFLRAIRRIEQQPHHELKTTHRKVRGDQLRRLDSHARRYLNKRPRLFQAVSHGIPIGDQVVMPTHGLVAKKDLSFDTLENRFVKWMMRRIVDKLGDLYLKVNDARNPYKKVDDDPQLNEKLVGMKGMLEKRLKSPFWRNLGELDRSITSLVLQMKTGYKEAYQIYLIVSRGLTLRGQLYKMSVKDVATLYEYWTFLKLGQILSAKYEPVSQNVVKVTHHGLFVDLDQSKSAKRVFRHPQTGERIELLFQNHNGKLPTVGQIPDTTLQLQKKGKDFTYHFIFDAKYRIDFAAKGSHYQHQYVSPGPLEEDVNTMHRYRDALVVEQNGPYERMAFGAYVLFPGFNEDRYENHHFYKSIDEVNIGGFPFLPQSTRLVEQFLEHLIDKSPEEIQQEGILPRGAKEDWESSLEKKVLVGLVKDRRRFEVHWKERFYHIPVKQLSKGWQEAKYVALYLPQRVSTEHNGIYFYGKVENISIKRRDQIVGLPSKNQEEYAVIGVDGWLRLDHVIPPVGYGVRVYTMTTLQTLKQAKELPELFMKSSEEVTLWRMMRRLSDRVQTKLNNSYLDQATGIQAYRIKHLTLKIDLDRKMLFVEDQAHQQELPLEWLNRQPSKVFKTISGILIN